MATADSVCASVQLGQRRIWAWIEDNGASSDFHVSDGPNVMVNHDITSNPASFATRFRVEAMTRIVTEAYNLGRQDGKLDAEAGELRVLATGTARPSEGIAVPFTFDLQQGMAQYQVGQLHVGPFPHYAPAIVEMVKQVAINTYLQTLNKLRAEAQQQARSEVLGNLEVLHDTVERMMEDLM